MSAESAPLLHGSAVVTAEWLIAHLAEVKVVDASWAMRSKKRDDFNRLRIAGAVFFDVDESSAPAPALPHTFPSAEQFNEYCSSLGLSNTDTIIIYDSGENPMGARCWFMLQAFGHSDAAILSGGLAAWVAAGGRTEDASSPLPQPARGSFVARADASLRLKTMAEVRAISDSKPSSALLVDARPPPRFHGQVDEPRPGLLRGHVPGAVNFPFDTVSAPPVAGVAAVDGVAPLRPMQSPDALRALWAQRGDIADETRPIVATCGSGLTACILIWSLHVLGRKDNVYLYDGSFSEWGQPNSGMPLEL